MGQIRRRDSADIRRRALAAAAQKYAEGCIPCVASYLDLAREHGATEHEIGPLNMVLNRGVGAERCERLATLDRRKLLHLAATAVMGVAGSAVLMGHVGHARASAPPIALPSVPPSLGQANQLSQTQPVPGAFGVDSCTPVARATAGGLPLQFYIGELGATKYGVGCFNSEAATYASPAFTHGYWGVSGPNDRPAGVADAAAFGQVQALAAIEAWNYNQAVGGHTIFADVESGFGGWGAPATPADAVALLDAFLRTIDRAGFVPGVYINNSEKAAWFPANYVGAVPFVYWVAGGPLAGTMAAPCMPGDTVHPVSDAWTSTVHHEAFGGMQAVVWQYWLSGTGCAGDFNYSPQSGYAAFAPMHAP